MSSWLLSLEDGKPCNTPPICTAVRLLCVRQWSAHFYSHTFEKVEGVRKATTPWTRPPRDTNWSSHPFTPGKRLPFSFCPKSVWSHLPLLGPDALQLREKKGFQAWGCPFFPGKWATPKPSQNKPIGPFFCPRDSEAFPNNSEPGTYNPLFWSVRNARLRQHSRDHPLGGQIPSNWHPLKTRTSLNKEVRPFFLGDNRIWSFPLFLLFAITAFGGPEGYFSLAIIAFGAFGFIVPKYHYRLGNMDKRSLDSLI